MDTSIPDQPRLDDQCEIRFDEDDLPILHYNGGHEKLDNIDYRIVQLIDGDHTVNEINSSLEAIFDRDGLRKTMETLLKRLSSLDLLKPGS